MNKLLWHLPQWIHRLIERLTGYVLVATQEPVDLVTFRIVDFRWTSTAEFKQACEKKRMEKGE